MSFIDGFIGGAAQTGLGIIDAEYKKKQAIELAKLQEQLAVDRARTIEQIKLERMPQELKIKADADEQSRQKITSRIKGAAEPLVQAGLDSRYAATDAAVKSAGTASDDEVASFAGRGDSAQAPLSAAQMDTINQSKAHTKDQLSNSPKVLAQAAMNAGYYGTGEGLLKAADAGKVTLGYGSKVIDQNQLDDNGNPVVIGDNSVERSANQAALATARQTSADAAKARALSPKTGGSNFDQMLNDLTKQGDQLTRQLNIAQHALNSTLPADKPAAVERINEINRLIAENTAARAARAAELNRTRQSSANPANPSTGADFSGLWR